MNKRQQSIGEVHEETNTSEIAAVTSLWAGL